MATYTPIYNWYQPMMNDGIKNGHVWGAQLSANFLDIEVRIHALVTSVEAGALPPHTGANEGQTILVEGGVADWHDIPHDASKLDATATALNSEKLGGELPSHYATATPFVGSGTGHAAGLVPDPGPTPGTTRFLCEDSVFRVPVGSGSSVGDTFTYYDPTKPDVAPSAQTDEFTGSALDPSWTLVNQGSMTYDVGVTKPGALTVKSPAIQAGLFALLKALPAGDFTIFASVDVAGTGANYAQVGLLLSSTNTYNTGSQLISEIAFNTAWKRQCMICTNFNSAPSYQFLDVASSCKIFVLMRRSGTSYTVGWSVDGATWQPLAVTPGFTPAYMGLEFGNGTGAKAMAYSVDFFRYYPSATAVLGGTRNVGSAPGTGMPPWFLPTAFTPPTLTDFVWVNQGTATASQGTACMPLTIPANAGDSNRILVKALPSPPYVVTMAFVPGLGSAVSSQALVLRDSVTGKLIAFDLFANGNEIPYHRIVTWNSATSAGSVLASSRRMHNSAVAIVQIADDGTNRTYRFSRDGQSWEVLLSHARTTWVVPNQVGVCGSVNDATYKGLMNIVHWSVA